MRGSSWTPPNSSRIFGGCARPIARSSAGDSRVKALRPVAGLLEHPARPPAPSVTTAATSAAATPRAIRMGRTQRAGLTRSFLQDLQRLRMGEIDRRPVQRERSEEHTSELQSLMRISYAVFCLKKKK